MADEKFNTGDKVIILDHPKEAVVVKYKSKKGSTTKFVVIEWYDGNKRFEGTVPEGSLKKVN